ncbi:MAG: hypothetical protein CBB82_01780 [Betaproteobacteria bacterium TMED22]|nr:MAG: hypothetical protein CBB82_01780 [Betaproteobacteria bacterium TMED22]|tara:strand:+ start:33522 stop:34022 length:501 start_codon:yes stop_codon:yes gene_type:complete
MYKFGLIITSMIATIAVGAPIDKFVVWDKSPAPPPLNVATLSGGKVSLTDFSGRNIVLNFWASWCAPCLKEIPSLLELKRQLPDEKFEVLFANYGESKEQVKNTWLNIGEGAVTFIDPGGKGTKAWIDIGLPTTVILNKEHEIIYKIVGDIDWSTTEVVNIIKSIP